MNFKSTKHIGIGQELRTGHLLNCGFYYEYEFLNGSQHGWSRTWRNKLDKFPSSECHYICGVKKGAQKYYSVSGDEASVCYITRDYVEGEYLERGYWENM
jgi:hypothetical protein